MTIHNYFLSSRPVLLYTFPHLLLVRGSPPQQISQPHTAGARRKTVSLIPSVLLGHSSLRCAELGDVGISLDLHPLLEVLLVPEVEEHLTHNEER